MAIQEVHKYRKATDTIYECVVNLDDERRMFTVHAFDNYRLPGRQLSIKTDSGHILSDVKVKGAIMSIA